MSASDFDSDCSSPQSIFPNESEDIASVSRTRYSRIPNGDFVSVSDAEGHRVYLPVRKERSKTGSKINVHTSGGNLLGRPFSDVLRDALTMTNEQDSRQPSSRAIPERISLRKEGLWVDKYSPHTYSELLSDESMNRTLLRWLKSWDHVVFNKPKPVKKQPDADKFPAGKSKYPDKKPFIKKIDVEQMAVEFDDNYRPARKVVLMSGRAGLGKTTLAHVLARHSGYQVVEMNASDDRSIETFKKMIDAMQYNESCMGGEHASPNCFVIDEIDGAPQASINLLLNYINKKDQKTSSKGPPKKKKKQAFLNRPVICICNDMYAPALRALKQVALVLQMPNVNCERVADRLMQISNLERIDTDMATLAMLSEKTGNDIRSSINTLQFVQRRGDKSLTSEILGALNVGQKNEEKNLNTIWRDIFTVAQGDRFATVLSSVSGCGSQDTLLNGIFENFLTLNITNPLMDQISQGSDWLVFHDLVNSQVMRSQVYQLWGYLPFAMVFFHFAFALCRSPKVQFPRTHFEVRQKRIQMEQLFKSVEMELSPSVGRFVNSDCLMREVLPSLADILQPSLRQVNVQLFNPKEKADLKQTVSAMVSYSLTYIQQKDQSGAYVYTLEPDVDMLTNFPGMKKQITQLSYQTRQLISNEVSMEKMRREDHAGDTPRTSSEDKPTRSAKPAGNPWTPNPTPKPDVKLPNHKQKLEPRPLINRVQTDFFGQPVIVAEPTVEMTLRESHEMLLHSDIWFKFKAGFSNAVRKPVKMRVFM